MHVWRVSEGHRNQQLCFHYSNRYGSDSYKAWATSHHHVHLPHRLVLIYLPKQHCRLRHGTQCTACTCVPVLAWLVPLRPSNPHGVRPRCTIQEKNTGPLPSPQFTFQLEGYSQNSILPQPLLKATTISRIYISTLPSYFTSDFSCTCSSFTYFNLGTVLRHNLCLPLPVPMCSAV